MKKLRLLKAVVCCMIFVLSLAGPGINVSASNNEVEENFTIQEYHISAVLHENNTLTVGESMNVNFHTRSHGIFRNIPMVQNIKRTLSDGRTRVFVYDTKVSNVYVKDDPFTTDTQDSNFIIKIGDEDKYVFGKKTYTFGYRLSFPEDRVEEYDEFYYSFVGTDWGTTISAFSFDLTLDKEADLSNLQMYVGRKGSTTSEGLTYKVNGNKITGSMDRTLYPNEAVTILIRLPEGYFVGARTHNSIPTYILFGVTIAFFVISILRFIRFKASVRHLQIVKTVEFYPPNDLSSADVGFIMDGTADKKDILSLIVWFATKGYITIEEKEGKNNTVILKKIRPVEEGKPLYIRYFFDSLFENGADEIDLDKLSSKFLTKFETSKKRLREHYTITNKLHDEIMSRANLILSAITAVVFVLGSIFTGGAATSGAWIFSVIMIVPLFCIWFTVTSYSSNMHLKKGILTTILYLAAEIAVLGVLIWLNTPNLIGFEYTYLIGAAAAGAVILFSYPYKPTTYRIEMLGKLLGLKEFIETAELPKLEALVMEDPEYFYSVLPYAYVFGLTNKWIGKFEKITVPAPNWYVGYNPTVFMLPRFYNHLNTAINKSFNKVVTSASNSGGGFGGGGSFGSSGGGFGGGGGGSW